jgi:hypothetical protein
MKREVTMLVGVPGSGKTWITKRLKDKYSVVEHDNHINDKNQPEAYVAAIKEAAEKSTRPLLIEAPFSISQIKEPLEAADFLVRPVFIIEDPLVVSLRYLRRDRRMIPKGHLTRMQTYAQRAKATNSFYGTAEQVLQHLQGQ